jgi:predicted dinucleotide-binding enzyme
VTRVAILGAGEMGMALARALDRGGVPAILGARDPRRVVAPFDVRDVDGAIAAAEAVILAVPYADARGLCERLGGKIVIDPTTPWDDEIPTDSGAEQLARLLPRGAALAAAWKTTYARELDAGVPGDVFLCSDDAAARACAAELIRTTGFRALDGGALVQSRVLEGMCRMMGSLSRSIGGTAIPAFRFSRGD